MNTDRELLSVLNAWSSADPVGARTARVFRDTFDQLYDGQRTGRYRWDQLFKTEKTHFGTLIEINLRREFDDVIDDPDDKTPLDYQISGIDIDCKYSMTMGSWMIPREAVGHLLLVGQADDKLSEWNLGIVRATVDRLNQGKNQDNKRTLNAAGRAAIHWIWRRAELPPNVLLHISDDDIAAIFAPKNGQPRVDELFRRLPNRRIGRSAVATVGQQLDPMKRVRENGGARGKLKPEGLIILSGDWRVHRTVAAELGCTIPAEGEFVSVRVTHAKPDEAHVSYLDGRYWRIATDVDPIVRAPTTPIAHKSADL